MMIQIALFDDVNHVAMVREILDRTPEFGPGDHIYVADGGVTECIIDRIVEEAGTMLYECHTDSLFPVQMYLTKEEIFSNKEMSRCRKKWEEMEERHFNKIIPKEVGIESFRAFHLAYPKPIRGKRTGTSTFAVLSNGFVYVEHFGEPAKLLQVEEPYEHMENLAKETETKAHEQNAMCLKSTAPVFKDIYIYDGKYMSWDGIRYEIPDLRRLRVG